MWDGQEMIYDKSNLESFFSTWEYIEDQKAPLMQYIGIKDMNGVEVYEGDIVELANGSNFYIGTIIFSDTYFCIKYKSKYREVDYEYFFSAQFRVIGNIYENPELLDSDTPKHL